MSSTAAAANNSSEPVQHLSPQSRRRYPFLFSPAWMIAVGLGVRIASLLISKSYHVEGHWHVWEMSAIGFSLAVGHGFGSPWGGLTGPTAWTAPLYPFLVALIFRIFGVLTPAAALALFTFNSIFSALTSWTIYRIGCRVFNDKVGAWSGWIWALYPYAVFWSVRWIWETTLSTFLLSLLFLLTLEMEGDNRLWPWCRYGLLWALVALTNTSTLSFLPFAGCWLAYRLYRAGQSFVVPVVLSAIIFWAAITPWLVRNYVVFHKFIFIRGDLGSELRTGNNADAKGTWVPDYRAGNNPSLLLRYTQMGEVAFDAEQARLAKAWIAENPKRFLLLCALRVYYFWTGWPEDATRLYQPFYIALGMLGWGGLIVAIRRHIRGSFLFASLLVFYPLVYYIVFPTDRYHHAIEPELLVLSAWFLLSRRVASDRGIETSS